MRPVVDNAKAALAHERSEIATMLKDCDEVATALESDADPTPDHVATIAHGEQRANQIDWWLKIVVDDWLD